ncbi:MAG TPA: lysylphosphatidylglycerol synthase transmembrane domain-containing protein, partial [Pirellulaceae bacterium]
MKTLRLIIQVLGITLVLACLGWQFTRLDASSFQRIRNGTVEWRYLAIGLSIFLVGVVVTFVRWYVLAQALSIELPLGSAIGLGFLGYLLQFVSLGTVGGDVFKAFLVAKDQPGRRSEVIASVVVDRLSGFLSLLLIAALVCVRPDVWEWMPKNLRPM